MFGLRFKTMILPAAVLAFSAGMILPQSASATTVNCPATTATGVIQGFNYTTDPSDPAVLCLGFGDQATSEKAFESSFNFPSGSQQLAKSDASGFVLGDWFSNVDDNGDDNLTTGTKGSFTFLGNSQYDNFILLFKAGGNDLARWSAIGLAKAPLKIDWEILTSDNSPANALSHLTIYGTPDPTVPIPLPAGGLLLITALGGLGIAARRRRKAA